MIGWIQKSEQPHGNQPIRMSGLSNIFLHCDLVIFIGLAWNCTPDV